MRAAAPDYRTRIRFTVHQVTRTRTTRSPFTFDDGVKKAPPGGIPPLDPKRHLNRWVCALRDNLLDYVQSPGGPPGDRRRRHRPPRLRHQWHCRAAFNNGRTLTHDIVHYLNLRPIWADTDDCAGSDLPPDTPNCGGPNYGKPKFPTVNCGNGPHRDTSVNYMDYVDDAAMFMFTAQQVVRMRAALEGVRWRLLV
jgi:hypothetical protein